MNLLNYYWYFKNAIPPRICDMILQYGAEEKEKQVQAITGGLGLGRDIKKNPLSKKELKDLKKKRDSNVVWMSDRWIYKEIQPYIAQANENAVWNFEWDFTEPCQFTIYKKGQYYDWHCDSWEKPYDSGKTRKLSMTVSLTDPKKYKGGELEFDFRNRDPHKKRNLKVCTEILPQGSVVVFPSFVWHRVRPVTKGVRYSLVCWNLGYPFK